MAAHMVGFPLEFLPANVQPPSNPDVANARLMRRMPFAPIEPD